MGMDKMEITLAEDVAGVGKAGQRVSLALTPADVNDPTEIPTYLAGFKPFGFRADEASPPVLVDKDQGQYRTFNSDDAFRTVVVKGSDQGSVPEVDPKSALTSYAVVNRYIGAFIPAQTESNVTNQGYDPRMAAGRRCRRALDLDREIDLWDLLGTSTNWDSSVRTAVAGGSEWNVSGDPIYDLQTAIDKSWQPVTDIWMNQKIAFAFLRHEEVRAHMRQMLGDQAASAAIGAVANAGTANVDFQIPGLPTFRVAAAKKKNDTTGALGNVLGDVVVLVHTPVQAVTTGDDIQSSVTFRRRGPSGTGVESREFFIEDRGPLGGTMIVVSMADVPKIVSSKVGGIITNVHT